jgi:hypothetical protein
MSDFDAFDDEIVPELPLITESAVTPEAPLVETVEATSDTAGDDVDEKNRDDAELQDNLLHEAHHVAEEQSDEAALQALPTDAGTGSLPPLAGEVLLPPPGDAPPPPEGSTIDAIGFIAMAALLLAGRRNGSK